MAELLKKYGSSIKGFTRGQKIQAKLVSIGKKSAVFNVSGKGEGLLVDAYFREAREYVKSLQPGDTVSAIVMDPETADGSVLISLRHAAADALWEKLLEAKKDGAILSVNIKSANSSGLSIEYEGISGFIPSSQIGKALIKDLESLTGKVRVKVIEVDKRRKKAVFSEKAVSEAKDIEELQKVLKTIKEGEIYEGVISKVADFGCFVSIKVGKSKIDGLVHVSELAWEKTAKPSDLYKLGDEVKVRVLGIRDGKLALSIKQALEDPWKSVEKKFKVEDKVKGKVVRISDFGTFVELTPGIEGLIHITKIPPATKMEVGQEVNCYIEEIDLKNKKIALGIVLTSKPLGYK